MLLLLKSENGFPKDSGQLMHGNIDHGDIWCVICHWERSVSVMVVILNDVSDWPLIVCDRSTRKIPDNPPPIHHVDFQILLSETPVRKITPSDWFVWPTYSFPTVWSWPYGYFLFLSLLSIMWTLELVWTSPWERGPIVLLRISFSTLHLSDRLSPCCQVCVKCSDSMKRERGMNM